MLVRRVELRDVRSYRHAVLELDPGVTVLVGANGEGKTNLLEAVHRVATGGSHRVTGDGPLVRAGADVGVIRLLLLTDEGRRRTLELEVASGRRTRTRVDGQDVRRLSDAFGILRVVLFAPEDLGIVRGDPGDRRRFLDDLLAQRRPAYAAARSEYERVVRQRNNLLRQLRGLSGSARAAAATTVETWTEQLIGHAASVTAARLAAVHALAAPVDRLYREVADRSEISGGTAGSAPAVDVTLTYRSSAGITVVGSGDLGVPDRDPIEGAIRAALHDVADEEQQRGVTMVGPHRDDLDLTVGALPARTHASQGEAWSLALALKLATYEMLAEVGDRPVVMLDDVFAELDTTRRARLARACASWEQVLVTAAVEQDVPLDGERVDVQRHEGASRLTRRCRGSDPTP